MEKELKPEHIEIINRIVFEQIDKMQVRVDEILAETERTAHQQLQDSGIDMTEFYPANKDFLMMTLVQHLIDQVHGGDMGLAQKIITMEAKRLNVSIHVEQIE
ncbi:nitroreductase [Enterobacter asburiae]|uniref:nitroreductase n=1 Tax=Enterobacter asburiae TaxID=61645 RepID=UPI00288A81F0|nr:nitroreductase [Enterobacter asburiae]WNI65496.1 nitroreductase [Enterobacter asburiae]WNI69814.1 nitroreductase [Enterobacter asburiae]